MVYNNWSVERLRVTETRASMQFLAKLTARQMRALGLSVGCIGYITTHIDNDIDPQVPERIISYFSSKGIANLRGIATREVHVWLVNYLENIPQADEEQPIPTLRPAVNDRDVVGRVREDAIREHELRYSGTYAIYKEEAVYVHNMMNDGSIKIYSLKDGHTDKASAVKESELTYIIPKLGYVNIENYAILLERETIRRGDKYKKSFHYDSYKLTAISEPELIAIKQNYKIDMHKYGRDIITNYIVPSLFFRSFPTYQEALDEVTSFKKLSCAFSSTLCIKLDKSYNKFVLLKNKWIIATLEKDTWKVLNNSFNEELDRFNIKYEVLK